MTSLWPMPTGFYAGQPGHPGFHNNISKALDYIGLNRYFVEDYGAVGNGTTDDATAINAAFAAASAAGGGTVVFRPGKTYLVGSTIVAQVSNLSIVAYGATLKAKAGAAQDSVLYIHGTGIAPISNVAVMGLTVNANYGEAGGTQPRGVKFEYVHHGLAEMVTVQNAYVSLDFDKGCQHCTATNCEAYDYYNDGFDACGTLSSTLEFKPYDITFIGCSVHNGRAGCDHAWELEDGAHDIKLISCWTDGIIGIKNHDLEYSETHNITLVSCVASSYVIVTEYPAATNYVKDVILIDCVGTVADDKTISGLTIIGRNENLFPKPLKTVTTTEPADATIRNGECALWFDQATSALRIKAKQNNGTVIAGSVALA